MADILHDYREALGRLRSGRTINVPKGIKISNDSVSLEAGRKKGTIKRSRPIFKELIDQIDAAAAEQARPQDAHKREVDELRSEMKRYRRLWEEALAREVSLFKQLWEERQEWAREKAGLTGEKVVLMNSRRRER